LRPKSPKRNPGREKRQQMRGRLSQFTPKRKKKDLLSGSGRKKKKLLGGEKAGRKGRVKIYLLKGIHTAERGEVLKKEGKREERGSKKKNTFRIEGNCFRLRTRKGSGPYTERKRGGVLRERRGTPHFSSQKNLSSSHEEKRTERENGMLEKGQGLPSTSKGS